MGWYGSWNLEYTGKNKAKFINTAKLVIANFKKRFEISDDNSELEAVKGLSWYSADMDIEKILSYLDDGDQIHVLIDGETHPYDDNDEELEWEEQTYKKENGQVSMECEYTDCDRYQSDRHGMKGAFIYELSYPDRAREETISGGYTDTLDTYIQWIAQEMGDSEEMMPIIQSFMSEIMNISREDVVNENGLIDEEAFAYFNDIKAKFETLESTKEYISEVKSKLPQKEAEEELDIPDVLANMSKRDVKKLGGMEQLVALYNKEGEAKTIELLTILGYDLSGKSKAQEKAKGKQSKISKRKEASAVNDKIKEAVTDYFLGCVKKKYPNLTEEDAQRFTSTLGKYVDSKLEYGGWSTPSFSIDYDPCDELQSAFYSMKLDNIDSGLPIYGVFPIKTSVFMHPGKGVEVSGFESEYLYLTDEYRDDLLTSANTAILREESKIPQEIKDGFEAEYQTTMETLNIERERLVKKDQAEQEVLSTKKALQEKAESLIASYGARIDELETLGLTAAEIEQRKKQILQETKKAEEQAQKFRTDEKLSKIREEYGWETLSSYDRMHKDTLDKSQWMRRRYIQYAREIHDEIWEQHRKEHTSPGDFSWPDTSSVPSDLDRLYAEKTRIDKYDRKHSQEQQIDTPTDVQQNEQPLTDEQQKFVNALGKAYTSYVKDSSIVDEYSLRNQREQILLDSFSKYFASNYDKLTNPAFLVDFENGEMRKIFERDGFNTRSNGMWMFRQDNPHIQVSEGLIYSIERWLGEAKIEYGTLQAIQERISSLDSKIRYMQDSGSNEFGLEELKREKQSFESYQRKLLGQPKVEPSLQDLDREKAILEAVDGKTTSLLNEMTKKKAKSQKQIDDDAKDFDD